MSVFQLYPWVGSNSPQDLNHLETSSFVFNFHECRVVHGSDEEC
jgi:hypothetical protein